MQAKLIASALILSLPLLAGCNTARTGNSMTATGAGATPADTTGNTMDNGGMTGTMNNSMGNSMTGTMDNGMGNNMGNSTDTPPPPQD